MVSSRIFFSMASVAALLFSGILAAPTADGSQEIAQLQARKGGGGGGHSSGGHGHGSNGHGHHGDPHDSHHGGGALPCVQFFNDQKSCTDRCGNKCYHEVTQWLCPC